MKQEILKGKIFLIIFLIFNCQSNGETLKDCQSKCKNKGKCVTSMAPMPEHPEVSDYICVTHNDPLPS